MNTCKRNVPKLKWHANMTDVGKRFLGNKLKCTLPSVGDRSFKVFHVKFVDGGVLCCFPIITVQSI